MRKSRFTDSQILDAVKRVEAGIVHDPSNLDYGRGQSQNLNDIAKKHKD